jgi:hypothetical protein
LCCLSRRCDGVAGRALLFVLVLEKTDRNAPACWRRLGPGPQAASRGSRRVFMSVQSDYPTQAAQFELPSHLQGCRSLLP